jgi:hypothetical protein
MLFRGRRKRVKKKNERKKERPVTYQGLILDTSHLPGAIPRQSVRKEERKLE